MQLNGFKTKCAEVGCTIYTSPLKVHCLFHETVLKSTKPVTTGVCVECGITAVKGSKFCYSHSKKMAPEPILAVSL